MEASSGQISRRTALGALGGIGAAIIAGGLVTACGDDKGAPSSDSSESTATTDTADEAGGGDVFAVGFSNPLGSNASLSVLQRSIEARGRVLGWESTTSLDANLDINKQLADIDQLIASGVNGIIVFPLDAKALNPAIERAKAAGIKAVCVNLTLGQEVPELGLFDASVDQGQAAVAREAAEIVLKAVGAGARVLGVGLGFPVPALEFQLAQYEALIVAGGGTWLGRVDNPTDDAAGAQPVVEQAITRFDSIDAVMCYNDPSAVGAASAFESQGETAVITGSNGSSDGVGAVKSGRITATWDLQFWLQGLTMANVVNDLMIGSPTAPSTTVPTLMLTKDNLDQQVDAETAIKDIEAGKLVK